jgi:hypothetical protein
MTISPHAFTTNGHIHSELLVRQEPAAEQISRRLRILDGQVRYSLGLWAIPSGRLFDRIDLDKWPQEYIQVAAESPERMIVEVRRLESGVPSQYAVGRGERGATGVDLPSVVVRWAGIHTTVEAREVFTAAEATDLFLHYYEHGDVPPGMALRRLQL